MIEVSLEGKPELQIGLQGLDEIIQNIKVILATTKGEVVLDRDFGISGVLDKPEIEAKSAFEQEVIEAIEKYEPRVRVSYIKWKEIDQDGKMVPVIGLEVISEAS